MIDLSLPAEAFPALLGWLLFLQLLRASPV